MEKKDLFENLIAIMCLKAEEVPSIQIESVDDNPRWRVIFLRDFVEGRIDRNAQVGIIDVLGTYDSKLRLITIYSMLIRICAHNLHIDSKILEDLVLSHELAHAATHLGLDGDGQIWTTFGIASTEMKEYFAQWYSHKIWSNLGFTNHLDLMFKLADMQPKMYGAFRDDIDMKSSVINLRLLEERHKKVEGRKHKICEFCNVRVATTEVARWDTWLMKNWTIPACSVCAPRNVQTWLT